MNQGRKIRWWQGALVEYKERLGIIASHDCDLAADTKIEPSLEWIPVSVTNPDGSKNFGKNPRILQLTNEETGVTHEMDLRKKELIRKDEFSENSCLSNIQIRPHEIVIFRRWLSSRYGRSAFPDSFENAMNSVREKIDRLSRKSGKGIRAIYFDLDDGHMIERSGDDDPYELVIYVVYPISTQTDEANLFSKLLSEIFKNAFLKDGVWIKIELQSCDAICEDTFPLLLANSAKTWRADHRSLASPGDALPEPDR